MFPNASSPPGTNADGSRTLTVSDGLAIINDAVGIPQPFVGDLIPGRVAPPSNRITITTDITSSQTWTNNNVYELAKSGGVFVESGVTLTIQAGTIIEGERDPVTPGGTALVVKRGGRVIAEGTLLQPIVMTCKGAPKFKGCWGGLVVNGFAPLNSGVSQTSPDGSCWEAQGEGSTGLYGGCNAADNSGIYRYLIVEYAGFRFNGQNELNGIAFQGAGNGTIVDFIQSHAGLDDGLEFFGGTVNVKHVVLTANQDDNFDFTQGYSGKAQFIIVQGDSADGDKGFEMDNNSTDNDALPRSVPTIYNVTLVGKQDPTRCPAGAIDPANCVTGALHARVGARPIMRNFLVMNYPFALDLDNTSTCASDASGAAVTLQNSAFFGNTTLNSTDTGDPAGCGSEEVFIAAQPGNTTLASNPLISPYDVIVPDWRPLPGLLTGGATPPSDGFFDVTATYIGAVPPATSARNNVPWYSGWTRGWQSATVP